MRTMSRRPGGPRTPGLPVPDAAILSLRSERLACRVVAERLGIPEHKVWSCLRRHGRTHEFRAEQANHLRRGPRYGAPRFQPVVYTLALEKLIRRHGSVTIEEAAGGGYIASFGDSPGTAQDTIGAAIRDAAEAREMEAEECS